MMRSIIAAIFIAGLLPAVMSQPLPQFENLRTPEGIPDVGGPRFEPPVDGAAADGTPIIYSNNTDARADETVFLKGARFGEEVFVFGLSSRQETGGRVKANVRGARDDAMFVTVSQREQSGLYLLWPRNDAGYGKPIRINAPQPWWVTPDRVTIGGEIGVYGKCLATLPDNDRAVVYLTQAGERAIQVPPRTIETSRNALKFDLPNNVTAGTWRIWVHAGMGGKYGWGGPLQIEVLPQPEDRTVVNGAEQKAGKWNAATLQSRLDELSEAGGGILTLPAGKWQLDRNIRIPKGVTIQGSGPQNTILQMPHAPQPHFAGITGGKWNQAVGRIHTAGDRLFYDIQVPQAGQYSIWMRYGAENSPYGIEDMAGHTSLKLNDNEPLTLTNLPNTGSFGTFKWSKVGTIQLPEGECRLTWENEEGGGINLDGFAFAADRDWQPPEGLQQTAAQVKPSQKLIVLHGEDVVDMDTKEGTLPGRRRALLHIAGNNAGVRDLKIVGSQHVNIGVYVHSAQSETWLDDAEIENVGIVRIAGKSARNNCGVLIERGEHVKVRNCNITARAPIFMRGIRQSTITNNELIPVTRYGNGALAAILGRMDTVNECVVTDNTVRSLFGGGGPPAMRMVWLSTGHGSVDENYIARNSSERMRFGGVAGMNQNVGEIIVFEANERMAYYGKINSADAESVTLPEKGPFWPPESEWEKEPALTSYYVQIVSGKGLGQVRRAVARDGQRIMVDRPWRVTPDENAKVLMTNMFARNIITDNKTFDGMTGIQLWISCWQNVVRGNTIRRQRKPGIFLAGFYTKDRMTMKNQWNDGIGVFWYNDIEGNWIRNCSEGILLVDYNRAGSIDWPISLGTVIRHNTLYDSRRSAVNITGREPWHGETLKQRPVCGTVCEFNVFTDQATGISADAVSRSTITRRNHFYFWHNWTPDNPPTVFDSADAADFVRTQNRIEGKSGGGSGAIIITTEGSDEQ